jgi:hypothetical protein
MTQEQSEHLTVKPTKGADFSTRLRVRITHGLRMRHARPGTRAAKAEDMVKVQAEKAWHLLQKRPVAGSVLIGGLGLAVATTIGVGELALGLAFAYAAYEVLGEGMPAKEAAEQMVRELEVG